MNSKKISMYKESLTNLFNKNMMTASFGRNSVANKEIIRDHS